MRLWLAIIAEKQDDCIAKKVALLTNLWYNIEKCNSVQKYGKERQMRYSESTLVTWTKPASDTEETKIENTISMIKNAINESEEMAGLDIEIFVQGSYANNTNVKTNSDVDVCVMLKSTFYAEYPQGKTREDYGFTAGTITFDEYKGKVQRAVVKKFGSSCVTVGNKSLKIRSNTYHVNADVVVALMLKNYKALNSVTPNKYIEGTRFYSSQGKEVTNYPQRHISNGKSKNIATNHNYKYLVRIFKRIRNMMVTDQIINGDVISSFLVECLVWNVPNSIITEDTSWTERVKESITYLYNSIKNSQHKEWCEVSEMLYLFVGRKWSDLEAKDFMHKMWSYLEY